jgi:hypothetical protein
LLSSAWIAARDILLLGRAMLTGLMALGRDNFILKAIFGPVLGYGAGDVKTRASLQKLEG